MSALLGRELPGEQLPREGDNQLGYDLVPTHCLFVEAFCLYDEKSLRNNSQYSVDSEVRKCSLK